MINESFNPLGDPVVFFQKAELIFNIFGGSDVVLSARREALVYMKEKELRFEMLLLGAPVVCTITFDGRKNE